LGGNGHAGGSGGGAASNDIKYEAETTPPLWIGGNSSGISLGIHIQGSVYGNNGGSIYNNRYFSTNPNTIIGRSAGGGGAGGDGGVDGIGSGGAGIMNTMYRGIEYYWGGGGGGALYTFDGIQVSDGNGGIGGGMISSSSGTHVQKALLDAKDEEIRTLTAELRTLKTESQKRNHEMQSRRNENTKLRQENQYQPSLRYHHTYSPNQVKYS
jgi:hypothetical protein